MKKNFLFLLIIALFAIGCKNENQINQIKEDVEQYMLTESNNKKTAIFVEELGMEVNFEMEMVDFNTTPVDTITDGDLYMIKVKNVQNELNESLEQIYELENIANLDSIFLATYSINNDNSYNEHLNRYNDVKIIMNEERSKVDSIYKVLPAMEDTMSRMNNAAYYVYQFSEKMTMTHPDTKELIIDTLNNYAYVNANTFELVKVDEDKELYQRNLDDLK